MMSFIFKKKYWLTIIVLILGVWFYFCLPDPLFREPLSLVVEDRSGNLIGGRIASDGQWRFPLCEKVPDNFKTCITQFEDKRFYDHFGVDPLAIARAIRLNYKKGRTVSGGSTISMQVIRLSRKGRGRTYFEKIIELFQALRMELSYSKEEILSLYCTYAPFGGNVVGLETASWKYFGRSGDLLSWAEYATLAVLPNRPSIISPSKNRNLLKNKRDQLLEKLYDKGYIDSIEYKLSLLEPLPSRPRPLPSFAPHLMDHLQYNAKKGGRVKSTIDRNKQALVSQILENHWHHLKQNEIYNISAMLTDVSSGDVLAYVGNVGYFDNKNGGGVDMIHARRSTGSILKPILYASCLDDGLILPGTLLPDVPTYFGDYSPQNYSLNYSGAVSASEALIRSLNVPTIRLLSKYGQPRFYNKLTNLGYNTLDRPASHYGLSIILGGAETNIWDLSSIYSGMARTLNEYVVNDGQYSPHNYRPVRLIKKSINKKLKPEPFGLLSAASIYEMFESMLDVSRPGLDNYWRSFSSEQKIAWKTGTSFGFRDAWALGCTPKYVLCVWVGNASGEGRPDLTGSKAAAPVLFDIFNSLDRSRDWFDTPFMDMDSVLVCKQSGFKASKVCPDQSLRLSPKSSLKLGACDYHKEVFIDPDTEERVSDECMDPMDMKKEVFFVLPPAQEWYYKNSHPEYKSLPNYKQGCLDEIFNKPMQFIYPKHNIKFSVPRELGGELGYVVFEAKHRRSDSKIFWHIDNEFVGETKHIHELALQPDVGKHMLTIVDENGEMLQRSFEVTGKMKSD